jgi:FtsH-binding integral membrane protein
MSENRSNMPEFLRKIVVALKRRPQTIPLLVFGLAFLIYSLNLTHISHTTARIQGVGMGLCGFITMLFSILSFVCFSNAFPKRKKPNYPMLGLMFAMLAAVIFCDIRYRSLVHTALNRAENPIALEPYIEKAYAMLGMHIVTLLIGVALILLLPVYSKWLRRIKTSVTVEDYGKLGAIDISGED